MSTSHQEHPNTSDNTPYGFDELYNTICNESPPHPWSRRKDNDDDCNASKQTADNNEKPGLFSDPYKKIHPESLRIRQILGSPPFENNNNVLSGASTDQVCKDIHNSKKLVIIPQTGSTSKPTRSAKKAHKTRFGRKIHKTRVVIPQTDSTSKPTRFARKVNYVNGVGVVLHLTILLKRIENHSMITEYSRNSHKLRPCKEVMASNMLRHKKSKTSQNNEIEQQRIDGNMKSSANNNYTVD